MKKLKLDFSKLRVETFASDDQRSDIGTVHALEGYTYGYSECPVASTCLPNETCEGAIGRCFPDSSTC